MMQFRPASSGATRLPDPRFRTDFMYQLPHSTAASEAFRLLLPILIGACGALPLGPLPLCGSSAAGPAVDTIIAVIGADDTSDYGRGALLGIEEGRRSTELLQSPLRFQPFDVGTAADAGALVGRLAKEGVVGIVAALPGQAQDALEASALREGIPVIDARVNHSNAASEGPGVFRIGLPDSVYGSLAAEGDRAVLWHAGLFRYGAEQLNERYRRRFDGGMTAAAWAGWMAVKALTEAALRAQGRDVGTVLADRGTAFDGHKGAPLSFSGSRRTMAQPLYVIEGDETREIHWPEESTR